MYNNTNIDVKVPVQKYHLNLEMMGNKGNMYIYDLCCSVWILILCLWCCILLDD